MPIQDLDISVLEGSACLNDLQRSPTSEHLEFQLQVGLPLVTRSVGRIQINYNPTKIPIKDAKKNQHILFGMQLPEATPRVSPGGGVHC